MGLILFFGVRVCEGLVLWRSLAFFFPLWFFEVPHLMVDAQISLVHCIFWVPSLYFLLLSGSMFSSSGGCHRILYTYTLGGTALFYPIFNSPGTCLLQNSGVYIPSSATCFSGPK